MSNHIWVAGVIVEFENSAPCRRAIIRAVGRNEIVLSNIFDRKAKNKIIKLSPVELNERLKAKEIKFLAEENNFGELTFIDLTEKEQREVSRRYKYIKELKENGIEKVTEKNASKVILAVALELDEKPPHWQTVRTWFKNFVVAGRKMKGLYPRHRFKGGKPVWINEKIVEIINHEAKRYYKQSQPSMQTIVDNVHTKIFEHNQKNPEQELDEPAYNTIKDRILNYSYQKKKTSRAGKRAMQAELASSESGIITNTVLERVEIDHTRLDIHVLDDKHQTLLGRPTITVLIDHYSYMVLGFQMSFEEPSFASVSMACINAFLPKNLHKKFDIDSEWPAHGIPQVLVTDNGNEFWGNNFSAVVDELGSIIQYCPIRKGNYKSRVERFFGIINAKVLDDLPGVVRKANACGESYDARQEARMTFSDFKRYFLIWLVEVYHNSPVGETRKTPNELWQESEEFLPIPVESEDTLLPILMETKKRKLGKSGIRNVNLFYNSGFLKDLYRRDGPSWIVIKYNPFDLGFLLVLDSLNKTYVRVDCEQYSYANGLSLFEHKNIRAEAKKVGDERLNDLNLKASKLKLAKERDKAHARNRRRKIQTTVSKAARSEQVGVEGIKLVIDNSKVILPDETQVSSDLDMAGWDIE